MSQVVAGANVPTQTPAVHTADVAQASSRTHVGPSIAVPAHVPSAQTSDVVQTFASSQGVPVARGAATHREATSSQTPKWHASSSSAQSVAHGPSGVIASGRSPGGSFEQPRRRTAKSEALRNDWRMGRS